MGPRRRTPSVDVRDTLVNAGRRVLRKQGLKAVTVRTVAAEAGVAPMGVYNYLDGKDGLLTAIIADGFVRLQQLITGAVDADARLRLREAGRRYRLFALQNPPLYRLMFSQDFELKGEPGLAALDALTQIVLNAHDEGFIQHDDPSEVALAIWSCVHGAVILELEAASPVLIDRGAVFELVLTLIERGLQGNPGKAE